MGNETDRRSGPGGTFSTVQRVMLVIAALWLAWIARDLLLLLFTGVLLAIFLRTPAVYLAEKTRLSEGWALAIVCLTLLVVLVGAGAAFAPRLGEQARQLTETLPQAATRLEEQIRQTALGGWVLEQTGGLSGAAGGGQEQLVQQATGAARKLFDVIVAVAIVFFTGLYFAAAPRPYQRGLLRLFPTPRRRRVGETLFSAGYTLRWWIIGQLLAMTIVGVLMGAGLAFIGVPLAFALGVLAGLFEFIPTIGPVFALLPALLLAVAEDPQKALYVLILYGVVQTLESYLITPLVQQRVLHVPPVVTIATQVLFAWTLGAVGLLVAVPFIATVLIAVQMLYVKDFLGDRMPLHAEREGKRELDESGVADGVIS